MIYLLVQLITLFGFSDLLNPISKIVYQFNVSTGQTEIRSINSAVAPNIVNQQSLGVVIDSPRAVIVDVNSNQALWKKSANDSQPIASITKLMTALVFLEHNPGWDNLVEIDVNDYRIGGRRYIFTGQKISVNDLFNLALIASSNEAVAALVRATGLSESDFVKQMNDYAIKLGMKNTFFSDPTGLDTKNTSTAEDLTKLIIAASANERLVDSSNKSVATVELISKNQKRKIIVPATDRLLGSFLNIIVAKTGYLPEAGYCMASLIANEKGNRLAIVTLGATSSPERFQDIKSLSWWAFKQFQWPK
jgi:D-alanyl-D-alanine carboxypeptidase